MAWKLSIAAFTLALTAATGAQAQDIVNSQITDSVTQANTKVVGDAPAMSMGNLYQASAQALGNAAHNATTAQQNANTTLQATTTQGVSTLYNTDTASTGEADADILGN